MQKRNYIAVLAGPLLIIILVFAVLNSGFLETPGQQITELSIEVSYTGPWEGIIYNDDATQQISGFSEKTINVIRPSSEKWILSFHAGKKDGSSNILRATIKLTDGTILKKAHTDEPYGEVQLSVEIE